MTKPTLNTRDQLRALINTHAETTAAAPTSTAIAMPMLAKPDSAPSRVVNLPAASPRVQTRQSLRLLPFESEKITTIINNTIQNTGIRATATDVLRAGLAKLSRSAHITAEELKSLRASDRRRIADPSKVCG